ncbi:MAG TPA: glycosyltransferase [bacterium]|nr:glycosyltransferase [bacterium]
MPDSGNNKVLVLLIGEVLDDPRVYKTCLSLRDMGAEVTIACTNPNFKPHREIHRGLSIYRFPHRKEFFLKKFYHWLKGRLSTEIEDIISPESEKYVKTSISAGIKNFILDLNFRHFMKSTMKINRMMVKAFSGESFDLIHCNDVETLFAGNELRRYGVGKALLYDSHEYWAGMGTPDRRSNRIMLETEAEGIKKTDYVVTVNPLIAERLMEQYNLDKKPSVILNCPYLCTDTEYLNIDMVHSPVRIIFHGKMQAYRGLPKLLLALKHCENCVLTMSGYGPLKKSLELIAGKENISEKIIFTDRYKPEDSIKILGDHDIGIIPYEDIVLNNIYSSPNKLFEYAMAGLAVVASNLPFIAGVVKENNMGEILPGTDPESIAESLNTLISDHERLILYKKNARKAAVESFSWEKQFTENYPWKPDN